MQRRSIIKDFFQAVALIIYMFIIGLITYYHLIIGICLIIISVILAAVYIKIINSIELLKSQIYFIVDILSREVDDTNYLIDVLHVHNLCIIDILDTLKHKKKKPKK